MKWKQTPLVKIYEAFGAVADGRVEVSGNTGKVYSSSRNKFYDVQYDPASKSIMANDNASYYQGYLGYPGIAFLMAVGELSYPATIAEHLKGFLWKDINTKFKNDFNKALNYVLSDKSKDERTEIDKAVLHIDQEIKKLDLNLLGQKVKSPEGY